MPNLESEAFFEAASAFLSKADRLFVQSLEHPNRPARPLRNLIREHDNDQHRRKFQPLV